jgi:putative polysaccharide biosynthesis protein
MSTTGFALDTQKDNNGLKYLEWLREAMQSGKSVGSLVSDVAGLGWSMGKLQPSEYFLYHLYDDERFSPDAKKTFLGADRLAQLLYALDMPWPKIANDKPTLTALLRGHDLPIPETQAMRHKDRSFPGAVSLRNKSDVERFLRKEAKYPIFGKPTDKMCSLGVANIQSYDASDDLIVTKSGQRVPVSEFAEQVEQYAEGGYLLQTRMAPHPDIVKVVGDQISTVRMFVLVDDQGPLLLRAAWKIPSGESVADNFWRSGNMLGGLDVETGEVLRVLRRTANSTEQVETHPKTGTSFKGLKFPHWNTMRETVMRGAAALPSCHFQGWDVALTDRGPVLVEVEGDGGDPIMEQLCFDTGLLQGRYLEFAKKALSNRKQRKKKARARARNRLRENLAQLTAPRSEKNGEQVVARGE